MAKFQRLVNFLRRRETNMKTCTDKERKLLDLLIGQPEQPDKISGNEFIKLMNEIRVGNDIEKLHPELIVEGGLY